jgi:ribose transport system permease protein
MSSMSETPVAPAVPVRARSPRVRPERYAVLVLLLALIALFAVLAPDTFATWRNAHTILFENSILAVLALGVMVPLIANDFDLSIASMLGLASMLTAGLASKQGFPVWLVFASVLVLGVLVGLLNAALIVGLGLPSFVVTLGTGSLLTGATLLYSGGKVIFEGVPTAVTSISDEVVAGLRWPVLIVLVVVVALWFALEQRPWGRRLYAIGSSAEAARLAGVPTKRIRTTALVLSATLAALAGILLTARVGAGYPTISGDYFLPSFAAAFLSVACFRVGFYNPWGVVLAVLVLAVGVNGLKLLGVPFWVEPMFNGGALVLAVALTRLRFERTRRPATADATT